MGKKGKMVLGFVLFVGFGIVNLGFHAFTGLYLAGLILGGLGIWLRHFRDGLEFYRRLKRCVEVIGTLSMFSIFLLFIKGSEWGFWFLVSVEIALITLLLYTKRKYGIIAFQSLNSNKRGMDASVFPHVKLFLWFFLRNKPELRNEMSRAEAVRNKGRATIIFETAFPTIMLVIIILFATGIVK